MFLYFSLFRTSIKLLLVPSTGKPLLTRFRRMGLPPFSSVSVFYPCICLCPGFLPWLRPSSDSFVLSLGKLLSLFSDSRNSIHSTTNSRQTSTSTTGLSETTIYVEQSTIRSTKNVKLICRCNVPHTWSDDSESTTDRGHQYIVNGQRKDPSGLVEVHVSIIKNGSRPKELGSRKGFLIWQKR